jgi:hypothetical protein
MTLRTTSVFELPKSRPSRLRNSSMECSSTTKRVAASVPLHPRPARTTPQRVLREDRRRFSEDLAFRRHRHHLRTQTADLHLLGHYRRLATGTLQGSCGMRA